MQEKITNAVTGEVTIRDLSPEEIAALCPPPPVPPVVTRLQARIGLKVYGKQIGRPTLFDEVEALVHALKVGDFGLDDIEVWKIKDAWANALEFRRESAGLNLVFPLLGLTLPDQLDELFRIAARQVV